MREILEMYYERHATYKGQYTDNKEDYDCIELQKELIRILGKKLEEK